MRKVLKRTLWVLGGLVIATLGGFYVLVNHSTTVLALTCSGVWEKGPTQIVGNPETAYAVIEEYRPWIVWTESDGNFRAETKDFAVAQYAPFVSKIGTHPLINYMISKDQDGPMMGGYRSGSRELVFEFSPNMLFVGKCVDGI